MEEWEITREICLWQDWDKVKAKAEKSVSEVLDEKKNGELAEWALGKVRDKKLQELKKFLDGEK